MQCNIGQAVDLDQYGFFNISASTPDSSAMKIGKNGYVSQGDGGVIYIIVGVQDPVSKNFDSIFVDPDGIYPNMSGTWQPQEKLQWWYESGNQTSTMFDKHDSAVEVGDFSAPDPQSGTFKKESTYSSLSGIWTTKPVKCKPSNVFLELR
jgi:hypothetical protein